MKLKSLTLTQNILWSVIGNLLYGLSQWLVIVFMAKLSEPESIGVYSLGIAITTPIFLFSNLNLRVILATDNKSQSKIKDYVLLRVISILFSLALIPAINLTFNLNTEQSFVNLLLGVGKSIESINDIYYGYSQKEERMDLISKSLTSKSLWSLLMLIIGLYLSENVIVVISFYVLGIGVSSSIIDVPKLIVLTDSTKILNLTRLKNIHNLIWLNRYTLQKLFILALPAGLLASFLSFSTYIPRYLTEAFLGSKELGFYAAILFIPTSGIIFISSISQSSLSRLSKYYISQDFKKYYKLIAIMIFIAGIIGGVGILAVTLFGEILLTVFYSEAYKEYNHVFEILMIGGLMKYIATAISCGAYAIRNYKAQLKTSITITCFTAISSYFMIKFYGLEGAAWAQFFDAGLRVLAWAIIIFYSIQKTKSKDAQIHI